MSGKTSDIDGTTSLDDYSGLKVTWVQTRAQLDAVEAENVQEGIKKYLGKRRHSVPEWFTVQNLNRAHRDLFGKVWSWAGEYRQTKKNIGVAPYQISVEMQKLHEDLQFWAQAHWKPIAIAARTHHRLVWIHPYENENGRHARLIGDMVLHNLQHPFPIWPSFMPDGKERALYLVALREADQNHFDALENFLLSYVS